MPKIKLSLFQLFSLLVLFELGSAIVVNLGIEAKADAWLAILTGLGISLFLLFPFAYLYYHYPKESLTVFIKKIVGQQAGAVIAVLYTCYFMYIGARVLRDFSELIFLYLLEGTPILVISFCMMAVIAYGLYLGIEVIGRTSELLLFITFLFFTIFLLFIYVSGKTNIDNLQPVLENGFLPVLKAAFPTIVTFPFGESIVFLMFFCFADTANKWKAIQVGVAGVILSGLILCFTTLTNIAVFGAYLAAQYRFPLLEAIGIVNIGNFIQRLDSIAILILIIGGFFKVTIFFGAAVLGFASFNEKKPFRDFILPVSLIIVTMSIVMADNLVEHLDIGLNIVPWILHIPFQFGIPFLLCMVIMIKNWWKKRSLKKSIDV